MEDSLSSSSLGVVEGGGGQRQRAFVRAGAGAGKTTELIRRVSHFILDFQKTGQDPHICLTTFTKKATQEIRHRLLLASLQERDPRLIRYVQQSSRLQISTIHSSLHRFLSRFGSKVGLNPDFSFVSSFENSQLIKRVLRNCLRNESDFAQKFSVLLEEWDLPTIFNVFQAWQENRAQFPQQAYRTRESNEEDRSLAAITLLKIGSGILVELKDAELNEGWRVYRELLQSALSRAEITPNEAESVWTDFLDQCPRLGRPKALSHIVEAKASLHEAIDRFVEYGQSQHFILRHEDFAGAVQFVCERLHARVVDEKCQRGKLTLVDLELWTLELLRRFPESGRAFSSQVDFWLIDEYQDTSPIQVAILEAFAEFGNEFVVGDPQQSIYLFRGARSEVFFAKENSVREAQGEIKRLNTNYRSAPKLMGFLNQFFQECSRQIEPMVSGGKEAANWPGAAALFWDLSGAEDRVVQEENEARAALSRITDLLEKGVQPEQIAILARRHHDLKKISALAREKQIPVELQNPPEFSETRVICDAIAWLQFLVCPEDNVNLIALLRSPWFCVSDQFLVELGHRGAESYWSRWQGELAHREVEVRWCLQDALILSQQIGVCQAWLDVLLKREFLDWSSALDPTGIREGQFWKLVTELKWAERQPGFSFQSFIEKLRFSGASLTDGEVPAVREQRKVSLMTIHASKGLEFEHVILMSAGGDLNVRLRPKAFVADDRTGTWSLSLRDFDSGRLAYSPWTRRQLEIFRDRELEESDRVLYVALTRAKRTICVLYSDLARNSWAAKFVCHLASWREQIEVKTLADLGDETKSLTPSEAASSSFIADIEEAKGASNEEVGPQKCGVQLATEQIWMQAKAIHEGVKAHRRLEVYQGPQDEVESESELIRRLEDVTCVDLKHLIRFGNKEWAFQYLDKKNNRVVGRIDLWGQSADGQCWIVDYKTGSTVSLEKAISQLRGYAKALFITGQIPQNQSIKILPLFLRDLTSTNSRTVTYADLFETSYLNS